MQTERDIISIMLGEHRNVRAMFADANAMAYERDLHDLYRGIRNELTAQMRAEERVVYPHLHRQKSDRDLVQQLTRHHQEIEGTFAVLDVAGPNHRDWQDHFRLLHEQVEQQFAREESLFERKLRHGHSHEELLEVGARYLEAKLRETVPLSRSA